MSQFWSNPLLFYYGNDHIVIKKLLVLRTWLGNLKSQWKKTLDANKLLVLRTWLGNLESQWKKTFDANKVTCESSTNKIDPTSNSESHTYFIEHRVCVTENSSQKYDENPEKLKA
jgi:hypothetical protein